MYAKKTLTVLIFSFWLINACKKDSSKTSAPAPPPPGIVATINGVTKSFNINAIASKEGAIGSVVTYGAEATLSKTTGEWIWIGVDNYNRLAIYDPIVPGTYVDTSLHFEIEMAYTPDGMTTLYEGGSNYDGSGNSFPVNKPITNHLKVTIVTLNDSSFIGTFSGNMYLGGITDHPAIPVTNGTFNVKFH